jgi:pyrroloquinoline quinone (PQQ) biosynthesis protein C
MQLRPKGNTASVFTDEVQQRLARWNRDRLDPRLPDPNWSTAIEHDAAMLRLEGEFIEALREQVAARAADVPSDAAEFVRWFERLEATGAGQHDPLFGWLEGEASLEQMRWYLTQEAAGEAGFDDLTAYAQVKLPERIKLELARNYWDEMGRGHAHGMHGGMLENTSKAFGLKTRIEETVWESLALANTMAGLAANRRYAYQSVGALGAIELTAPSRVSLVNDGLRRLGVSAEGRQYFQLHAGLDVRHSREWNAEVIHPLVADDETLIVPIAEGALMRLQCGQRCFERYRSELGI